MANGEENSVSTGGTERCRAVFSDRVNTFLCIVPFFCAALVVLMHSGIMTMPSDTQLLVEEWIIYSVPSAAVPVFFLISGFLFFATADSMSSVGKKLKRRIFTVLIPFVVWSALYYFAYTLGGRLIGSDSVTTDFSPFNILKGIVFYQYAYQLWFMFLLIGMLALSPVIYWILKSRVATAITFGVTVVAAALQPVLGLNLEVGGQVLFAWNSFMYFFFGCIVARIDYERWIDRFIRIPYAVAIAGLVVTGTLCALIFAHRIPFYNERFGVPFVAVFLMILCLKFANDHAGVKPRRIRSIPTMVVYGIHPVIELVLLHLLERFPIPTMVIFLLRFLLTMALSCGAAVVIKKIKPLNVVLNGNRK